MRKQTAISIVLLYSATIIDQTQPAADPAKKTESTDAKKSETPDAKKPDIPKEKSFSDIVKDARVISGLFTMYRTEEKVFLEVLPEQLDKVYMLSLTCESGIGERGFYAAAMCGEGPIVFHKEGKNVHVIAKNTQFTAQDGSPMARAVLRSFSDSILGMAKTESLPHPDRKSVLIYLGS